MKLDCTGGSDQLLEMLERLETNMATKENMASLEGRLKLFIDTNVTHRFSHLFDAYGLNHEKQWALERKVEALEEEVEKLRYLVSMSGIKL